MESKKELKIETFDILNDFKKHLEIKDNQRILFSGPFGTGKSTFLKEFSENQDDDFFFLKIFPVNYSVSSNEDVFELIKFDLLFQLMGRYYEEIKLRKEDFTLLLKSQIFIMERMKFMPLLYAILGFSEKIGTPIVDFIKALESTVGDFKKFNDEIKIDEEYDIHEFLNSIENKKGSQYEMDAISELIFDLIDRIKKENKKGAVLIIDDLDRLDPDHVFRIFNIFSAHHEEIDGRNKFGFDKVVFVCDIENVRKIFHHKYGFDVDFSGYIDKFYSTEPFSFNNRKYVKEKLGKLLYKINFNSDLAFFNFDSNSRFYVVVKAIAMSLVEARLLNLRMLFSNRTIEVPNQYFGIKSKNAQNLVNSPLIVLFYLFKSFYGSFEIFELKIERLCKSFNTPETFKSSYNSQYISSNYGDISNLLSYCLPFLLPEDIAYERTDDNNVYYSSEYECFFHFNGFPQDYVAFKNFKKSTKTDSFDSEEVQLNPYQILLDTFNICKKRGLLV